MAREETPFDGPWFRRGLLAVFVAALAILPLATLAIAVFVDGDEVTAWLAPRLSGALNREVTIGDAGVAFLPRPGLRLSDLRVGQAGTDLPSVVTVRDVHLEAALLPLVTGRVVVDHVRIGGLDFHLAVDEAGASNFGDLVPQSGTVEASLGGPVGFAIDEVEVEGASLTWFDGVRDRSFAVAGGTATLNVAVEADRAWTVRADGRADSLHLRLPGITGEIIRTEAPSLVLTLSGDGSLDWIEVEEGTVELWSQALALTGRIEGLSEADPRLDLDLENPAADLGVLAALIPQGVRARTQPTLDGTLDVALRLQGGLRGEASPALLGTLGLQGVGLRLAGHPFMRDVRGQVRIRPASFELDSITGTFADGPFLLGGRIDRATRHIVGTVSGSPRLEGLDELALTPYGSTLAGETDVVFDVSGPLAAPDSLAVTGSLRANGVQVEHERLGVPLYLPSAELEMTDSELRWTDLAVLIGTNPLATSGRLADVMATWWLDDVVPAVEASVAGDSLDLDDVFPADEQAPDATYARIAFAHLGGSQLDGRSVRELVDAAGLSRPEALPMHGALDVALGSLRFRSHDLGGLSVRLELSDSALVARDAVFDAWGGSVAASLRVGVGRRVDEPFAVDLQVDSADAARFLARMTPVGDAVAGRLDLDFTVDGTTDRTLMPVLESLAGQATLTVTDGEVAGTGINLALADFLAEERWSRVAFSSWSTELAIREGMLQVVRSDLAGEAGSVTLAGAVGLGGAVDLAMALSIPADQLEAVSLRRTGVAQTVLDRLRETGSSLDLGIRISGTLAGPTLEPDALAASERLAAASPIASSEVR